MEPGYVFIVGLPRTGSKLVENILTILGDKTGPNLYYVPTLVKWFPQAKGVPEFKSPQNWIRSACE
jgi:hypothetical protein